MPKSPYPLPDLQVEVDYEPRSKQFVYLFSEIIPQHQRGVIAAQLSQHKMQSIGVLPHSIDFPAQTSVRLSLTKVSQQVHVGVIRTIVPLVNIYGVERTVMVKFRNDGDRRFTPLEEIR